MKPYLKNYRNSEFIQFLKDCVKIYNAFDVKALKLDGLIAELEVQIAKHEEVFNLAQKNENTEQLENADRRRDKAIIGIKTLATAYEYHFDKNLSTAGSFVNAMLDKHGTSIAQYNLIDETNVLNSIIKEFASNESAKGAAQLLNISTWITELGEANEAFNQIYITRNKSIASQPDQNLRDLRQPAIEKYRVLINKTDAYYNITETKEYKAILDEVDSIIVNYNRGVPKPTSKKDTVSPPRA